MNKGGSSRKTKWKGNHSEARHNLEREEGGFIEEEDRTMPRGKKRGEGGDPDKLYGLSI